MVRHSKRDEIKSRLEEKGIGTLIHYPVPPHLSEAYTDMESKAGDFPVTEGLAKSVLSLPMGPHLKAQGQHEVISCLKDEGAG